jgi:hypothetical protein
MTTLNIETIEIKHGSHSSPEDGACVMEWVSIFAGLPFSDSPECTDPVVAHYARALNDVMPDNERWRLRPFIPQLAATKNGCPSEKRALLCADCVVRVFAVAAFKAAGLDEWADKLLSLAPITDSDAASAAAWAASDAAIAAARAASAAAWAASAAASDAAWAADPWEKPLELLAALIELKE